MKKEKYEADFAAAVTAFSSGLGPIIPPSITMIVYGVITGTSISKLFLAGAIPGIIFGVGQLIFTYIIAIKRDYPRHERVSLNEFYRTLKDVVWALLMPVIIIGGILLGVFTVTEAAAVAAVYSLFVGIFVYRELNSIKKLYEALYSSAMIVASIMILIGCAQLYSWLLVIFRVPQMLSAAIMSVTSNPLVVLLFINVAMLIVGMFVEANAAMILFVPILFPMSQQFGIDPVHLGIILVFNLCLGLVTPPVGLCISLAAKIAEVPLHKAVKATMPFMIVGISVLLLITYIPDIVLLLPELVYK
jgi:tripartite ATP-independent transporter DctM subunit